jgi:hypothetical protein
MPLDVRKTCLIPVAGHGVIKIVPRGGRNVSITAPQSLAITDKLGRPMTYNRRKPLTERRRRG